VSRSMSRWRHVADDQPVARGTKTSAWAAQSKAGRCRRHGGAGYRPRHSLAPEALRHPRHLGTLALQAPCETPEPELFGRFSGVMRVPGNPGLTSF
jgi:hypothetical protein